MGEPIRGRILAEPDCEEQLAAMTDLAKRLRARLCESRALCVFLSQLRVYLVDGRFYRREVI